MNDARGERASRSLAGVGIPRGWDSAWCPPSAREFVRFSTRHGVDLGNKLGQRPCQISSRAGRAWFFSTVQALHFKRAIESNHLDPSLGFFRLITVPSSSISLNTLSFAAEPEDGGFAASLGVEADPPTPPLPASLVAFSSACWPSFAPSDTTLAAPPRIPPMSTFLNVLDPTLDRSSLSRGGFVVEAAGLGGAGVGVGAGLGCEA